MRRLGCTCVLPPCQHPYFARSPLPTRCGATSGHGGTLVALAHAHSSETLSRSPLAVNYPGTVFPRLILEVAGAHADTPLVGQRYNCGGPLLLRIMLRDQRYTPCERGGVLEITGNNVHFLFLPTQCGSEHRAIIRLTS